VKKIIIFALFFYCTNVESQEYQRADQVYPENFVQIPLGQTKDGPRKETKSPTILDTKSDSNEHSLDDNSKIISPNEANFSGKKILRIGGIVDDLKSHGFEDFSKSLILIADKYDFNIGTVYVVKGSTTQESLINSLWIRGGMVKYVSSPPNKYNVTISPAWIIQTEDGQIVLEGISNIEKYINQRGEFLDKPRTLSALEESRNSATSLFDD